jgi:hypothetical protein
VDCIVRVDVIAVFGSELLALNEMVSVVEMIFLLDNPVEKSLYDYLVNSN